MKKILVILLFLVLTSCSIEDKTINFDHEYRMHYIKPEGKSWFPKLSFNEKNKSYFFYYDNKDYPGHSGQYEIKGDLLYLDNKSTNEQYVFRIIDEYTLNFVEDKSTKLNQDDGLYYKIKDGSSFLDTTKYGYSIDEFDVDYINNSYGMPLNDIIYEDYKYMIYDDQLIFISKDGEIIFDHQSDKTFIISFSKDKLINLFWSYFDKDGGYGTTGEVHLVEDDGLCDYKELVNSLNDHKKIAIITIVSLENSLYEDTYIVTEDLNYYLIHSTIRQSQDETLNDSVLNECLKYMKEVEFISITK